MKDEVLKHLEERIKKVKDPELKKRLKKELEEKKKIVRK